MNRIFKEPLVHFVLVGGLLFAIFYGFKSEDQQTDRIEIDTFVVNRLSAQFSKRWMRPPTQNELEALVEEHIKEEILYKEAIRMGLEQDDAVVRRRLRQKMEFISSDLLQIPEPTEEELQQFLKANMDKFRGEDKISFTHIYFSTERRGYEAESQAKAFHTSINKGASPRSSEGQRLVSQGDPTLLSTEVVLSSISTIKHRFGESFGDDISQLTEGEWSQPIASSYGYHLVWILERSTAPAPDLSEVRDMVQKEWEFAQQEVLQEQLYQEIKGRYHITVRWPESYNEDSDS